MVFTEFLLIIYTHGNIKLEENGLKALNWVLAARFISQ